MPDRRYGLGTMSPDRFYPYRPVAEHWKFQTGEVRYTHNGQRHIVLSCGWADNKNGFILPFGTNVGVASDCGWVWEPRAYPATELLSANESAEYRRAVARHKRYMAAQHRQDADNEERAAARLDAEADALTASGASEQTTPLSDVPLGAPSDNATTTVESSANDDPAQRDLGAEDTKC